MYCELCHSETCEHQDSTCPCCGNYPRENCVYDTPHQRHLKNLMNGKDDEQWVIAGMRVEIANWLESDQWFIRPSC